MPTYLRWTVAITSAITAYFAYSILTLGIASATGNKQIEGAMAGLVSLGAFMIAMIVALAVSDWIRTRYPRSDRASRKRDRDSVS